MSVICSIKFRKEILKNDRTLFAGFPVHLDLPISGDKFVDKWRINKTNFIHANLKTHSLLSGSLSHHLRIIHPWPNVRALGVPGSKIPLLRPTQSHQV
jgi:hypothetical protein